MVTEFLVIQPVRFLGGVFHASDSTKYLKDERDYLRNEIERLHAEVDRERNEKHTWQELFHQTLGIVPNVNRARKESELKPIQGRKTWKSVRDQFESKKVKEADERRRRSSEDSVRGSEESTV